MSPVFNSIHPNIYDSKANWNSSKRLVRDGAQTVGQLLIRDLGDGFLRLPNRLVVAVSRDAILAASSIVFERDDAKKERTADTVSTFVEDRISTTSLLTQLHTHAVHRENSLARGTGRVTSRNRSRRNLLLALRLEDLEIYVRGLALWPRDVVPQRAEAARLFA